MVAVLLFVVLVAASPSVDPEELEDRKFPVARLEAILAGDLGTARGPEERYPPPPGARRDHLRHGP